MDQNETSTDLTYKYEEPNFAKEVAKGFVLSTATSAGVWTGILGATYAFTKLYDLWQGRKDPKDQTPPSETA